MPEHSRSRLASWVKAGDIRVDGQIVKASATLRYGQRLDIALPPPPPTELIAQEMALSIVYEDEDLVVVDKPAGLVVHRGAGHDDGCLVNGLLARYGTLSPVGLPDRPGVVHRIDSGTSGLLVVARTELAHLCLARQFAEHTVKRRYLALAWDKGLKEKGTLKTLFGRHPTDRVRFTSRVKEGKHAITHWEVLERLGPVSLVALVLETGRTHQIRVHLSESDCPLVGDPLYGRKQKIMTPPNLARLGFELGLTHQALHAAHLGFVHPDGRTLHFESPLPADLTACLTELRETLKEASAWASR